MWYFIVGVVCFFIGVTVEGHRCAEDGDDNHL